jgi:hypothetical protein
MSGQQKAERSRQTTQQKGAIADCYRASRTADRTKFGEESERTLPQPQSKAGLLAFFASKSSLALGLV